MSAAGFDDGPEFVGLFQQGVPQFGQGRYQVFLDGQQGGQVNGGGNDIVGRLPHIHLVVGMHQARAEVAAQKLRGAVGDDFVGVGVGGSAGAGLKDVEDEMLVQPAVDDFLGGGDDGLAGALIQQPQGHIGAGRRLLHQAQGADERTGKAQVADGEVEHGAAGGGAVEGLGGNLHLAHRIAFDADGGAGGHNGATSVMQDRGHRKMRAGRNGEPAAAYQYNGTRQGRGMARAKRRCVPPANGACGIEGGGSILFQKFSYID